MSTVLEARWAGPYTSGEVPLPFTVKFDPTDIDFTGFSVNATLVDEDLTEMTFNGTAVWEDIDVGIVRIDLAAEDVECPTGKLLVTRRLRVWAGDLTNVVATLEVKFNCHPSLAAVPAL